MAAGVPGEEPEPARSLRPGRCLRHLELPPRTGRLLDHADVAKARAAGGRLPPRRLDSTPARRPFAGVSLPVEHGRADRDGAEVGWLLQPGEMPLRRGLLSVAEGAAERTDCR